MSTAMVFPLYAEVRGIPTSYSRVNSRLTTSAPGNAMPSSLYQKMKTAKEIRRVNPSNQPTWTGLTDRPTPAVGLRLIPDSVSGSIYSNKHRSVTSYGINQDAAGIGSDVKHGSYQRRLNRQYAFLSCDCVLPI